MERLDKFLADAGVGSRSEVRKLIRQGRICVDGAVATDIGLKLDTGSQQVSLDGECLSGRRRIVLLMNKPAGYVTATRDPKEKTVMELLPQRFLRQEVKPGGRLDKQTEGLLLFTNDGDLLHRMISPGKRVEKVYIARHEGMASPEDVQAFAAGLTLRDGTQCLPAVLEPIGPGQSRIRICEGKYHQVRRMMASRGMTVNELERVKEGGISLGSLPRGEVRELSAEEVESLLL